MRPWFRWLVLVLTALPSTRLVASTDFATLHTLTAAELIEKLNDRDPNIELALIRSQGKSAFDDALERWVDLPKRVSLSPEQLLYYHAVGCEVRLRKGDMAAATSECERTLAGLSDSPVTEAVPVAMARSAVGYYFARQGKTREALDQFEVALTALADSDDVALRVTLLHNRGAALTISGLTDLAIESFEQANSGLDSLPADDSVAHVLGHNLGYLQAQRGEYAEALHSYRVVMPWLVETRQLARLYIANTHVALALNGLGRYQEALDALLPWMTREDVQVTPHSEAQAFLALGLAYEGLGDWSRASENLSRGLAIAKDNDNPGRLRELTLAHATLLIDQGQFEAARDSLQALEIPEDGLEAPLNGAVLRLLAQAHAGLGEFAQAYERSIAAAESQNSVQSEAFDRRLASLRVSNELDVKDQQLALAREREATALAAKELADFTQVVAIGAVLVVIVLFFLARSRQAQQREALIQRRIAERLEQEVEVRTKDVEAAVACRYQAEQENSALALRVAKGDKLRALGQLTGGVAHDFNNLMTVILLSAEILMEHMDEEQKGLVGDIIGATNTGRAITSGLLAYARQQQLQPSPVELGEYLRANGSLFRRTLGESITLVIDPPDVPVTILVDEGQLTTSLLNLVFNAREASAQNGKITIAVKLRADDQVVVSVSDTGRGMSATERERAIDPFYTTKGAAHGSGLGLSMVYGFIKQSGGELVVNSEPGVGSQLELVFTRVTKATLEAATAAAESQSPRRARVMVVEDEERIRALCCTVLRAEQHDVSEAADGDAEIVLMEGLDQLDLLVTDVVMPGSVGGDELVLRARERFPALRAILISGCATEVPEGCEFLEKPFSLAELKGRVREQLATAQAR